MNKLELLQSIRQQFRDFEEWVDPHPSEVPEDLLEDLNEEQVDIVFIKQYEQAERPRRPAPIV